MRYKLLFLNAFLAYMSVCYAQGDIVKANNLKSHHSYVWHVENATDATLDNIDISVFNYDSGHSVHVSPLEVGGVSNDFIGDGYTTDPDHESVLISYKGEYYSIEDTGCTMSNGSPDVPVNLKITGNISLGFLLNVYDDTGSRCSVAFYHFGTVPHTNNNI